MENRPHPTCIQSNTHPVVRTGRRQWFCAVIGSAVAFANQGCAVWSTRGQTNSGDPLKNNFAKELPPVQIPNDASILEIAFVPLPSTTPTEGGASELDSFDESIVSPEVRSCFLANGLRIGRILHCQDLLSSAPQSDDPNERLLREASVLSDFSTHHRHLTCRDGHTYPLAIRRMINGQRVVLFKDREGAVVGRSVDSPQFMMNLKAYRDSTEGALVSLIPEVQYGQVQQNYVANETLAIRFDYSRQRWELDDLEVQIPLAPGQAIVVMPASPSFGLGEQMLVGYRADQIKERIAMVIRLNRRPTTALQESALRP